MHSALLLIASTMGVTYGWQPVGNGSLEYIIQIEPTLADRMQDGELITSELPPEVRGLVRRFRVQIGTDALPRTGVMHDVRKGTGQPKIDDRFGDRSNTWDGGARSNYDQDRPSRPGDAVFGPRGNNDPSRYEDPRKPFTSNQPPPEGSTPNASNVKSSELAKTETSDKKSDPVTAGLSGPQGWTLIAIIGFFVSLGANV